MSCTCHNHNTMATSDAKAKHPERPSPTSQCLFCAQKHADEAFVAMNEHSYELENRSFIHGSIRGIVLHTFKENPAIADIARNAALQWQQAHYCQAKAALLKAMSAIDAAIQTENPDIAQRIRKADGIDVIIPLGPGSLNGQNDELKILFRSLEKNCAGLSRVILVTDCAPDWINPDAVSILPMGDKYDDNKDANLIDKTLAAIEQLHVRSFVWMADDNAVMQPMDLREAPKVKNIRVRSAFTDSKIWHKRMRHTFDVFPQLTCNFDSHTPQQFPDAQKLLQCMRGVNYQAKPGLCIMTAFYASMGEFDGGIPQNDCKITAGEKFDTAIDVASKLYLGYDDKGFPLIRQRLFEIFGKKSRFEK